MGPNLKRLGVILLSFAVILGSGGVTYGVWFLLGGVSTLDRGVVSLLSWVAAFYVGAFVFWKALALLSPPR